MDQKAALATLLNSGFGKSAALRASAHIASVLNARGLTFADLASMDVLDMADEFGEINAPAALVLSKGPRLDEGVGGGPAVTVEEIAPGVFRITGDTVEPLGDGAVRIGA